MVTVKYVIEYSDPSDHKRKRTKTELDDLAEARVLRDQATIMLNAQIVMIVEVEVE